MADAIITSGIRALVIIPGKTGLAKDVFVNSFAFERNGGTNPSDGDLDAVAAALATFYNVNTVGNTPIAGHLSTFCDRAANACKVKVYRMGETPPRMPRTSSFTLAALAGAERAIPNEVALCASFKSTEQKGPRGRGRVYIGPLNGAAVGQTGDFSIRPTGALQQSLVDAMVALRSSDGVTLCKWCVYSSFGPDHLHPVTDVWCDNEFDTVRKRGVKPTVRVSA